MALPSGITHHWKLDDGSGATLTDSVGNADGTLQGTTGSQWDRQAQDGSSVLRFNGSDNHVTASVSEPAGDWSIVIVGALARDGYEDSGGDGRGLVFIGTSETVSTTERAFIVAEAGTGIRFNISGTSVTVAADSYVQVPVVVQAGYRSSDDSMFLRVNKKEATGTAGAAFNPDTMSFVIGRILFGIASTNRRYSGWMADAVWYDGKFLSSSERDDVFDALWERVNGSVSVSTPDTQISFSANATPFDGDHVLEGPSIYTPLFTTENNIYVAAPVTITSTEQSRLARLNKSYVSQENVQLAARAHNSTAGHRSASVAVDPNGTVVAHPAAHGISAEYQHSTSAEDLSTLTATADPSGADTDADYRRFFYDSVNSELYAYVRGNGDDGRLYKWDDVNKTWDVLSNNPFASWNGATGADYGGEILVHTNGDIYLATEHFAFAEGDPKRMAGVIKSTDGGDNWTDLEGNAVTAALDETEHTTAMPLTVLSGTLEADHDLRAEAMTLDSSGNPIVVGAWRNVLWDESLRSLWIAKWSSVGQYFTIHRILANNGSENGGFPKAGRADSHLFFIVTDVDIRDDGGWSSGPFTLTPVLYYYFSTDDGATWNRFVLDDGTGYGGGSAHFMGVFIDQRAYDVDEVVRVLPLSHDAPDLSEIWEFSLPAAGKRPVSVAMGNAMGLVRLR